MSWFFNLWGKKTNPDAPKVTENVSISDINKQMGYDFHSADLERAAIAAKHLEKSKYAKYVLELTNKQAETAKLEHQVHEKQYELMNEANSIQLISAHVQEERKAMQNDTNVQKRQMDYQEKLARKRLSDRLEHEARLTEQSMKKEEESALKRETMRRNTLEYEASVQYRTDMKLLEAKLRGEAEVERDNREIRLERARLDAGEWRETLLQSIDTTGAVLGAGFNAFIADRDKIVTAVAACTGVAVGVYAARYSLGTLARFAQARIGKPALVRETSRLNVIDAVQHPIKLLQRFQNRPGDPTEGIILTPKLEEQLRKIAISTRHTRANKGFYRNIMMAGPPGTGKTMFAKSLAMHSGMDYAILTGGDIAPMGSAGVTGIHKVFDWASTSRKGALLFIDEADAFLRKREQERISEEMRATLNAFLYRTGEQSNRFMLVLASNQPEQFDWAINDRMDEIVTFDLPGAGERERIVRHYFDMHLLQPSADRRQRIRLDTGIDYTAKCAAVATRTEGLSGRELSKLAIAWQTAAFSSAEGVLTEAMMDSIVDTFILANKKKQVWRKHCLPEAGEAAQPEQQLNQRVFLPNLTLTPV